MTRESDLIGLVEGYLDDFEGVTPLPDAARDVIRARLPSTPQRPAWWPGWRFPEMNTMMKYALGAAAALMAVVIVGIATLGGPGNLAGSGEVPTSTPAESPTAIGAGDLAAGTYVTHPSGPANMMDVTFTVPDGWRAFATDTILPAGEGSSQAPDGMGLMFFDVISLHSDPCHPNSDVEVGTTVDDLVDAFAAQSAYDVSEPTDVTLAGYSGKQLTLQLPSDLDPPDCAYSQFIVMDPGPWAQGSGNRWYLSILDVEGSRLVVFTEDFEGTSEADRAELQGIVDSIRITP